jgi:hypothetical protein
MNLLLNSNHHNRRPLPLKPHFFQGSNLLLSKMC